MGSFDFMQCCEIGTRGELLVADHLRGCQGVVAVERTNDIEDEGRRVKLQEAGVDLTVTRRGGRVDRFEVKTERFSRTGNLFLETWSNKTFPFQRPGWLHNVKAEFIAYCFLDAMIVYRLDAAALFRWAFIGDDGRGNLWRRRPDWSYEFKEKAQGLRQQLNATHGVCVPVATLKRELKQPEELTTWHLARQQAGAVAA